MRISDWSSDVCSSDLYPADLEPGLEASAFYDPANFTFPAGTHSAEVEIDADTGVTTLVNWVAVDDFGKVVNPMIVEGQVHGGIAQAQQAEIAALARKGETQIRSEEHTSELQSLMRISYAVFCLKKKR